jgi:tRNA threonylcarbamoyl adenosine modification protein YeaZ
MTILALEFSSERRSAAVWQTSGRDSREATRGAVAWAESSPRRLNAFTLIEGALQQAGVEREAVECVAVGLGPGSYTGIRAAISIAQGWALARGVRLLGLSSVEAMASRAWQEDVRGRLSFVVDAQRNEFYLATYEFQEENFRSIEPLRIVPFAEVATLANAGEALAGPEVNRLFPGGRVLYPDADSLARLALGEGDFVTGDKLEPIYLRETNFVKAPPGRKLHEGPG